MAEVFFKEQFQDIFLNKTPILDVRSFREFQDGHIPCFTNQPILNNEERVLVGTCYKKEGRDKAIALGESLVSGKIKEERIQGWVSFFKQNPRAILTCARGGLRSQFAQLWCQEQGIHRPRIQGGYKALRNFLLENIEKNIHNFSFKLIGGMTGSGKTELIRKLQHPQILDLEKMAHHRGSAFGSFLEPQPSQAIFENDLLAQLFSCYHKYPHAPLFLEDESRLIGQCVIPDHIFQKMRKSPVILVEESLESRTQRTFQEYVLESALNSQNDNVKEIVKNAYRGSIHAIQKKLGGLRTQEILKDFEEACLYADQKNDLSLHKVWVQKLLQYYYDPLYQSSMQRRDPTILFRGYLLEVSDYLLNNQNYFPKR